MIWEKDEFVNEFSSEIKKKVGKPLRDERAIDYLLYSRKCDPIGNNRRVGCSSDKYEYAGVDKTEEEDQDAKAYKSAKYKKAARRLTKPLWMMIFRWRALLENHPLQFRD